MKPCDQESEHKAETKADAGIPCVVIEKRAHSPDVGAPSLSTKDSGTSDEVSDSKNRLQKRRKQKKVPSLNIAATHSGLVPQAPKKSLLPIAARKCMAVSALSTVVEDEE